jgi:hypothetical protein
MSHFSQFPDHDGAAAALELGRGRGIKVAVIDSGIELSHPHQPQGRAGTHRA